MSSRGRLAAAGTGVGEGVPGAGARGVGGGLAPVFDFGAELLESHLVLGVGGDWLGCGPSNERWMGSDRS